MHAPATQLARLAVLLALLSLPLASCSVDRPPSTAEPEATPLKHIAGADSAIQRFSDALASCDTTTIRRMASEQFELVEDGRRYNLTGTIENQREFLKGTFRISRHVSGLTTHVKGRVAWSIYVVGMTASNQPMLHWGQIETIVFSRRDETWQVEQMTSQRIGQSSL